MHDLSMALVAQGHSVTVITPSSTLRANSDEAFLDGVKVLRFHSGEIKNVGMVKRAINEILLSSRAMNTLKPYFEGNPHDLIVYYSPSIFWGGLVKRLKKKWGCPAYLVIRDMFPQWVVDKGILKETSLVCRYFRFVEKVCYAQADRIGVQVPSNLDYFQSVARLDSSKLEVLYNWSSPKVVESSGELRKRLGLEKKTIFFFGGNLGHAQDMGNVLRLAERMQEYAEAHFLLVGQGDEVSLIEEAITAQENPNVTYLPPVGQDEYLEILSEVDVGLFSLHADHQMDNIPGKILGYLACEKPILGSVNAGNDVIELVENAKAGFVTENGEDDLFYRNAVKLMGDSEQRRSMGLAGKKLLADVFSTQTAAEKVLALVEE